MLCCVLLHCVALCCVVFFCVELCSFVLCFVVSCCSRPTQVPFNIKMGVSPKNFTLFHFCCSCWQMMTVKHGKIFTILSPITRIKRVIMIVWIVPSIDREHQTVDPLLCQMIMFCPDCTWHLPRWSVREHWHKRLPENNMICLFQDFFKDFD